MRRPLVVGILAETKNEWEKRAPLTPEDVEWLKKRKIQTEVLGSPLRCFQNKEYRASGAKIVKKFKKASLLIGIKEPDPKSILPQKIYCIFSHTIKGQQQNKPLLKESLKKNITLIDYECIRGLSGNRLVYFGRFAGICGAIDSLHYLGSRLKTEGYSTPFSKIKRAVDYSSWESAQRELKRVGGEIKRIGFPRDLAPFIIGVTGHGNVAEGALEVLNLLKPTEIHPRDMKAFYRHQKKERKHIYKIVLLREEKFRSKNRNGFYFEEYLKKPEKFESNLDQYLSFFTMLIHGSYWDLRYPRLVTKKMIQRLSKKKPFNLRLIGDLTCDIKGSIEITQKATTPDKPTFVYLPRTGAIKNGFEEKGIMILAVDNLPAEFPKESSGEFSRMIRDYIYQIAGHGVTDITNHHALPRELRQAVITQEGKFTKDFRYLKKLYKI